MDSSLLSFQTEPSLSVDVHGVSQANIGLGHHQAGRDAHNSNDSLSAFTNQLGDVDGDSGTDEGEPKPKYGKKTRGRVKIKMQFISNKLRRYTTFSKRKTGIMKKAYELSTLTGTQVMLLVASETGHVYTFATKKLQPMITSESGKALIQTCLNSPDSGMITTQDIENDRRMNPNGFEETELSYAVGDEDDECEPELSHLDAGIDDQASADSANLLLGQNHLSIPNSFSTTFNYNTIIPPISNSDGTLGKATNITMQVPQSSISLPLHNMSSQVHLSTSSNRNRKTSSLSEHQQRLERQRLEQQEQINQLQLQQETNHQVLQQLTSQQSQSIVVPKTNSASFVQAGGNTSTGQLIYQPSTGQTLLYTPTATINALDLVNLVNPQNISSLSTSSNMISPAGPQYITIPVSLATAANLTNQVFQSVSGSLDLGKKT